MTDAILAIDAGGTAFKHACVSIDGQLLTAVQTHPINADGTKEELLHHYRTIIRQAMKEPDVVIKGVGIATPGSFDYDSGTSYMTHKFAALYATPLKNLLCAFCGAAVPVWFCPDTNAFLAGEYAHGAARGFKNVIGITVGTGIGMAVIHNGVLCLNPAKGPKEVIYRLPCKTGILEDYVSGRGIAAYYKRLSGMRDDVPVTAKDVWQRAETDACAAQTYAEIGYLLGSALHEPTERYDAEAVVLGGQVANAFPAMEAGITRGMARRSCRVIRAADIDHAAIKGILELKEVYCI